MKPFLFILLAVAALQGQDPARVVVVANKFDPDSMRIARYYMEKRQIPEENLFAWRMIDAQTIDWPTFVDEIYNPLKERLVAAEWLQGVPGARVDPYGRRRDIVLSHQIDHLVLCRGVPLMIKPEVASLPASDSQLALEVFRASTGQRTESFEKINHHMRSAISSVDAELALLPLNDITPVQVFFPNPLHRQMNPSAVQLSRVIRVSRLDGPSLEDVKGMIDSALEGEALGLRGRAYIDAGGPHVRGNQWLSAITERLLEEGFDLTKDEEGALFAADVRFDAPAIYFGWHSYHVEGPFLNDGFEFPPGALAFHLHSFSAANMGSPDRLWTAPFVARRVAATVGNVHEPLLDLTHSFDLLMDALLEGKTFGEAAYYSLPALGWMPITVGDPLYRPFLKTLPQQLAEPVGDPYDQYVAIREMNQLIAAGDPEAALQKGLQRYRQTPGLALALKLAQRYLIADEPSRALRILEPLAAVKTLRHEDITVALEIAQLLHNQGASAAAYSLCSLLLEQRKLPVALKRRILQTAIPIAEGARELRVMMEWNQQLRDLE